MVACVVVFGIALVVVVRMARDRYPHGDWPDLVPADAVFVDFCKIGSLAPLPSVTPFELDGEMLQTLRLEPDVTYETMLMPDFPQVVEADGHLPGSRRVRSYGCSVNRHGIRGPRVYDFVKPEGVYRIGVIGTGVTFGEGVEDPNTYSALLERALQDAPPIERTFEVVNFGIPAMTTDYATSAYRGHDREYEVDLWVFALGVNDALPMFERPPDQYRAATRALVDTVVAAGDDAVVMVEPVNTFYPWIQRYPIYRQALDDAVAGRVDLLDVAGVLDCHERADGLRLEVDGTLHEVAEYRDGERRVLMSTHFTVTEDQPSIPRDVLAYLETHEVWLRTFITDVHLNDLGHEVVADVLYRYVAARLRGEPPLDLSGEMCAVVPEAD